MSSFLRQRRSAMRLSQGDLAESLGVSQQTVARWETSGQVPAKYIKDLAVLLGARAEDFLPRGEESPGRKSAVGPVQKQHSGDEDDDATLPFGDVQLHFSDRDGPCVHSYPVTWGTLNDIQEQLGDVGMGFLRTAPWIRFETLNNKWVAVNTQVLDRVTFADDDVEAMTSFEHEEVYKAARELWPDMPTEEEMRQEDYPYSTRLIERVQKVIAAFSTEAWIELEGLTVDLTSGERISGLVNAEVATSLDAMFGSRMDEDLEPNRFLQLTFRDNGVFEHVRLGAVRRIEASLLAFNDAFELDIADH
ncbi:helix-turn-helix transcriptional regulator [Rhodoferax sp. U11-2br]|uniref:helix-turn-helix transcriptional regulator n=1 Tax=Rhodoferax sp. U11-2br TaxID=2838878 RepID=UPI001BEBCFCD|nr:helix-turn-helix transcriptional regulator [Rhodoferax sp. U11-2br]MBT3066578.1 helix-turn-helix domain-containing protein [Rhodoferax sp. U11-2br]